MASACLTVDDIARYVGESLASTARSALGDHVEQCESCRATVAAAMRAARTSEPRDSRDPLAPGTCVGRYVVGTLLGEGGLGRVYGAYDPELDRKIALKLVRDASELVDADALARLTREAQLTARLSHPNVVAVYDVGTYGDQVFVAMELVDGEDLRRWLATPHSWREVLAMFVQAGHGIAAAHAANLIHRDVKPDNVLVGRDGRARVTDFGLARVVTAVDAAMPADGDTEVAAITRAGAIVGTPAYMAPEQLRGEPADARADQFSFCVSLYEGLYGERPFAGATLADRLAAIERSALGAPNASARDVPSWLRAVITRGLAADPNARYPSMVELLAALARDPAIRRRRITGASAGVALCALAVTAYGLRGHDAAPCRASGAAIAANWNPRARAALESAFRATRRPFAEQAIAQVERELDRYASGWSHTRTDACEATHVRHEQSADLLDRRELCLEQRRTALVALIALFTRADAELVDRAGKLTLDLPPLAACSDSAALLAPVALPTDPKRRAEALALAGQLSAATVLQRAARTSELHAQIDALRAPIERLDYAPLRANLDELTGALAEDEHRGSDAISAFDRAAIEAETGGDDVGKARALIGGARVRGLANVERELVERGFAQARAALARVGSAPDVEVRLELAQGVVELVRANVAAVAPHDRAALAIAERIYGRDDLRTAAIRSETALALERVGQFGDAAQLAADAVATLERVAGADHPRTIQARAIWAQLLFDQAKYDDALREQQHLIGSQRALAGDTAPELWSLYSDLGRSYEGKAAFGDALAAFTQALDRADRAFGATHPNAVLARVNVATALLELGRMDDAVAGFRDAIARADAAVGKDSLFAANANSGIANAWRDSHPAEALAAAREALRLFRKLEGEDHPDTGRGWDIVGRSLDKLDQRADAIAALERAVAIRGKAMGADHPDTADSEYALAVALDRAGQRARAIELAAAAKAAFAASGDADNANQIEKFMAARR